MATDLAQFWRAQVQQHLGMQYRPSVHETVRLDAQTESKRYTAAQVKWAVVQYVQQTHMPSITDFLDYLDESGESLPDNLVCAAFLSGSPLVADMAEKLETLRSAWFPNANTEYEIAELEAQLKGALT